MGVLKKIKYVLTSQSSKRIQNKSDLLNHRVATAFKLKYPNANAVQWKQIEISKWMAKFSLKDTWYSTLYDSQGNWLDTIALVPIESIPKNIQENFEKSFVKSGIKSIHQIETSNKTIYEIKWTNGIFRWNLLYDISGKMTGKLIS
mgnify:CR=1 FL=1|tara:strand:+ start:10170 stop:10607 length:438 start_codon:yes stop_codon:yes gene_type:complete